VLNVEIKKGKDGKDKNCSVAVIFYNGNRMTGEIERQRLQSEKSEQLQLFSTLVIFRFVRLNSCTTRQLGLPVHKTESSGVAVFTSGHFG